MLSVILLIKSALCKGSVVMTYSICIGGWGHFSNMAKIVIFSVINA